MDKLDLIIESTLNSYISNEVSQTLNENREMIEESKRKVEIEKYDEDNKCLLGKDAKSGEAIGIHPITVGKEVKRLEGKNPKGKKEQVEVTNFPNNGYIFGGVLKQGQVYWCFNKYLEITYFKYSSQEQSCVDLKGNKIEVFAVPESVKQDVAETAYTDAVTQGEQPPQGAEPPHNAPQNTQQGNVPSQGENGSQNANPNASNILNVEEQNPLSNAIMRLAQERYIDDDNLTNLIVTYLENMGL